MKHYQEVKNELEKFIEDFKRKPIEENSFSYVSFLEALEYWVVDIRYDEDLTTKKKFKLLTYIFKEFDHIKKLGKNAIYVAIRNDNNGKRYIVHYYTTEGTRPGHHSVVHNHPTTLFNVLQKKATTESSSKDEHRWFL